MGAQEAKGPGMTVKAFDEVCFNEKVGVVHGPVSTQFAEHLILITKRTGEEEKAMVSYFHLPHVWRSNKMDSLEDLALCNSLHDMLLHTN